MWNCLVIFIVSTCVRDVFAVRKLQIVHTNDMHARYLEVDENTVTCTPALAKENKCYGGFARIRQAAIEAREEATREHIPSIFLNAGDTFQGTPYYSTYKWEITAPLVDAMEFDAMSLGNHEFDDGIDNLVQFLTHIKAPTVATNLDLKSDRRLNETILKKSTVLNVEGMKIGIVGYVTPMTMKISKTEQVRILDEISSLREEVKRLKSNGTQLIIALGHSGLVKDQEVAREVEDIDIIVGGHSHTLLYTPKNKPPSTETAEEEYPFWVTQKSGKSVPIVQSSAFTKYFGKLIVTLNDTGAVIAAEGNSILLDHTHAKNADLESKVQSWTADLNARLNSVIGRTRVPLKASNLTSHHIESTLLNLITDAFIEKSVFIAQKNNLNQWTRHAVAFFLNSGTRAQIDNSRNGGNITVGDILTALPFKNQIRECSLTGASIKAALEIPVEPIDPNQIKFNNILHFSGLRVVYDLQKAPKNRVHSVKIICTECSEPQYEKLDEKKVYTIIADSYILSGAAEYSTLGASCKNETQFDPSTPTTSEVVQEYIQRHQIIYPKLDGRIQILGCHHRSHDNSHTPRK